MTANQVVDEAGIPRLAFSPGRIDPTNAVFASSRKPLAAELTFNGRTLFVIANHWSSKGGDRGQPTVFVPGRVRRAFTVTLSRGPLTWTLSGRSVTFDKGTLPRCR